MSRDTGMHRRAFLTMDAQPGGKVWRIGLLYSSLPPTPLGQGPFHERMRELCTGVTSSPSRGRSAKGAAQGGLMSYSYNLDDAVRLSADVVDKIMRGAKAGEIPIQQPTKLRLVINLETAKTLGLRIPEALLVRANQVIE